MSKKAAAESRAARAQALLEQQRRQERQRRLMVVGSVVAALLLITVVSVVVFMMRDTTGDEVSGAQKSPTQVEGYAVVLGEDTAPRTVTIYEDFQCPACADFESQTRDQLSDAVRAGKVKVEYRMVSFLDQASTNEYSSRALNAGLAVLETAGPDAFKAFHDALYANQPAEGGAGLSDDELIEYAVGAGAEEGEVRPQIEGKVYDQWIKNATDQMSKDGVTGTPTVMVDGKKAENGLAAVQQAVQ